MTTVLLVLITAGGTVVVALIGVYTARLAQRGTSAQTAVSERNLVLEGYDKLNSDLGRRNDQLNSDIDKARDRLSSLEAWQGDARDRISCLEGKRNSNQQSITTLIAYAHTLIGLLIAHGITVPEGPDGIVGHDWASGPRVYGSEEDQPRPDGARRSDDPKHGTPPRQDYGSEHENNWPRAYPPPTPPRGNKIGQP